LGNFRKTPKSIKENKYSWLFASEWQMIHNRMDGNSFTFFIGGNGTGKTFAALRRAEILGVDKNDEYGTLFDPDHLENHIFFDRTEMLQRISELEKLPSFKKRGYQFVLDEAQMTANAKDWNNKEVLKFSKEMTTIRSSRFSICLTMPTYKMITTDLRQLGTYLCEMFPPNRIDIERGLSYSKLHLLALKPYLGEVWRHRPYLKAKSINPILGLPVLQQGLLSEFTWELPSKTTIKNYEKLKKDFRKRSSELAAKREEERLKGKKKKTVKDYAEIVLKNPEKYKVDGEFNTGLLLKNFDIGMSMANHIKKVTDVS
jgi:hypothetical protein